VLLLAGGGAQVLAGELRSGGSWITTTLTDATVDAPALVLTASTSAVGVIRSTANAGELRYVTWTPGAWSAFAPIAASVTSRAAPSITTNAGIAAVVFQGDDYKHYQAAHASGWAPVADPVTFGGNQSFGPSPAAVVAPGNALVVAFAGNDHDLYDQTRSGGAWQAPQGHGLGDALLLSPAIVALSAGPDLMIAYVRKSDARVVYTTRTGTTWTAPAPIDANALTSEPVSLAALPGGDAVLAYRGQNGNAYWSRYTAATSTWSAAASIGAATVATPSAPSVAPGVGGVDAEMVYVEGATGRAMHTRLTGSTWSTPAAVGGTGLTHASVASWP
jgi:hypothetical protein